MAAPERMDSQSLVVSELFYARLDPSTFGFAFQGIAQLQVKSFSSRFRTL